MSNTLLFECELSDCDYSTNSLAHLDNHYIRHRKFEKLQAEKAAKKVEMKLKFKNVKITIPRCKDWGIMEGFHTALLPSIRTGNISRYYKCDKCPYQIKSKRTMQNHVSTHSEVILI